jgi:hypothetical protein
MAADLVLGLAKSAVEGTLSAAKSAIEEEKKLKKHMQRDLMLISDEFEMMHSFLNVSRERASNEMVRTLVRQVRNMALDVEDCIESAVLVDMKPHWWSPLLGRLRACGSRTCGLAAPPPTALDDAVAAIELLKSRVEAMGQRNGRYMQIGDCGGPELLSEKTHQQTGADATAVGILLEARDAKGKKKNSTPRDLIKLINTEDHDLPLQVISLWGSAGDLGVASIIKKTCDDQEIRQNFTCRAWVKLTRPFNLHEFIRSLLTQFYTNYCLPQESTEGFLQPADVITASEAALMEEFKKQVSNQRYLVFLEDVSRAVDWEAVRVHLPNENTGSCVVVHTQQLEVASLCVGQSHQVLELEQFSSAHSVCVFFNKVLI